MKELTKEEKAQITSLSASGWTWFKIGKYLKRSPHTIKKYLLQPDAAKETGDKRLALAEKYEVKAEKILDSISDKDMERAGLSQKALASGICLTKSAELRTVGPPGINVSIIVNLIQALKNWEK